MKTIEVDLNTFDDAELEVYLRLVKIQKKKLAEKMENIPPAPQPPQDIQWIESQKYQQYRKI